MAVHFIGIGGAGMSGIAKVLLEMGFSVSGSDLKASRYALSLEDFGAKITIGHNAENIDSPDVVVISSAIPERNVELARARELGIPVLARAEMLAQLARRKTAVAVAGTHGKTTTTSMISFILQQSGNDPTYLIGGELNDIGSNARYGSGKHCVIEADESDGSLMHLNPQVAVVTNIDADHLDYYGSFEAVETIFSDWLTKLPEDGFAVVLGDGSNVQELAAETGKQLITFGLGEDNDFYARELKFDPFGSRFHIYSASQGLIGELILKVPGTHNVLNALAASAFCLSAGIEIDQIAAALIKFTGVKRRFQLIGKACDVAVVDDYAHHPTEVRATLRAARLGDWKRIVCVFQPHRYSRTKFLVREFGLAFVDADLTVMTDIYSAGEEPMPGVTGKLIVDAVLEDNPQKNITYLPKKMDIRDYLMAVVREGDLVLTMGAGDIWMVGDELLNHLLDVKGHETGNGNGNRDGKKAVSDTCAAGVIKR